MLNEISVPRVVSESREETEWRLVCVVAAIIILMMMMLNYNCSTIPDTVGDATIFRGELPQGLFYKDNFISSMNYENTFAPCKQIVLTNLNKVGIPTNRVVVVGKDYKMYMAKNIATLPFNNGTQKIYELQEEMPIQQIILSVNKLCHFRDNIATTQIDVVDSDKNITWQSTSPLPIKKNITIDINAPKFNYPDRQETITDPNRQNQEELLARKLIINTYSNEFVKLF